MGAPHMVLKSCPQASLQYSICASACSASIRDQAEMCCLAASLTREFVTCARWRRGRHPWLRDCLAGGPRLPPTSCRSACRSACPHARRANPQVRPSAFLRHTCHCCCTMCMQLASPVSPPAHTSGCLPLLRGQGHSCAALVDRGKLRL